MYLKLICALVLQVLVLLFPGVKKEDSFNNPTLGDVYAKIKKTNVIRMCILNGCLAMLSMQDLTTEYKSEHLFLTDVLAYELLEISER